MPFVIQEKKSARGKFTMGNNPRWYRTAQEAFNMMDDLNEHGGCGPLRVVDHSLNVIKPAVTLKTMTGRQINLAGGK